MEWREPFVGGGGVFCGSQYGGVAVRSPLRYPGGKSKAVKKLMQYVPTDCIKPSRYWINDKHDMLIAFYQEVQTDVEGLIERCRALENSRETFDYLAFASDYDRQGVRYLFLNRTVWAGRVNPDIPSRMVYSKPEGWNLDTLEQRLRSLAKKLQGVKITCLDFEEVVTAPGHDVFLYLDPPYMKDTEAGSTSKLYRHSFSVGDHERLATVLKATPHRFMLSYDEHPAVLELYQGWCHIERVPWVNQGSALAKKRRVNELVITNYKP